MQLLAKESFVQEYSQFPSPNYCTTTDLQGLYPCVIKRGVGKTTTSINLAASLVAYGRRVLCIDFDPQGALSAGFGIRSHNINTIYDLLTGEVQEIDSVILPSQMPELDVIPANIDLSAAEVHLVNEVAREQILTSVIAPVVDRYDVIIVDCQPSLGLLTVNALTASHGVIVPLECEYFALRGVALWLRLSQRCKNG